MARKKSPPKNSVNKSQLIRETLRTNLKISTLDVVKVLQRKGVTVSPMMVSHIRSRLDLRHVESDQEAVVRWLQANPRSTDAEITNRLRPYGINADATVLRNARKKFDSIAGSLHQESTQQAHKVSSGTYIRWLISRNSKADDAEIAFLARLRGIPVTCNHVAAARKKRGKRREFFPLIDEWEREKAMEADSGVSVFLCHAKEDARRVATLYHRLADYGHKPWMDQFNLSPGQDWQHEIRKAIRSSQVFIACLSPNSVSKRGFVQRELKLAVEVLEEFPDGEVYIIPIRLKPCEVPERFRRLHWIDVNSRKQSQFEHLLTAIEMKRKRRRSRFVTPSDHESNGDPDDMP